MINWKVRFKNRVFRIQFLLSVFVPVLGYYGLTAQDFTTWASVFDVIKNAISNPYVLFTMLVGAWNAINDPTTKGVTDSQRAKQYTEPN